MGGLVALGPALSFKGCLSAKKQKRRRIVGGSKKGNTGVCTQVFLLIACHKALDRVRWAKATSDSDQETLKLAQGRTTIEPCVYSDTSTAKRRGTLVDCAL